ncbi:MAG TPA: hypothetical protein VFM18_08240 [Methanosarcina sp.]|nr:hypothetical protein [Methanosarcina sp.]
MTNRYLEKIASWDLEKEAGIGSFIGGLFRRGATKEVASGAESAALRGATRLSASDQGARLGVSTQKVVGQKRSLMNRLTNQAAPKSPTTFVKSQANTDVRRSLQGIDTANIDQPAYLRRAAQKPVATPTQAPATAPVPKAKSGTPVAQPTPDTLRNNHVPEAPAAPAAVPTAPAAPSMSDRIKGSIDQAKQKWNSLDESTRKNIKIGAGAAVGGAILGRATAPQQNNYPANGF